MIVIAELKKPCSAKDRADFIVENNHNKGYLIEEDDTSIKAMGYDEAEQSARDTEAKAQAMRARRDADLAATDFYLMADYPISAEDLEKIKAYRQALRDLPEQDGFPDVDYPENPLG